MKNILKYSMLDFFTLTNISENDFNGDVLLFANAFRSLNFQPLTLMVLNLCCGSLLSWGACHTEHLLTSGALGSRVMNKHDIHQCDPGFQPDLIWISGTSEQTSKSMKYSCVLVWVYVSSSATVHRGPKRLLGPLKLKLYDRKLLNAQCKY